MNDLGVVAVDVKDGLIVGMAWVRFWTTENHGFAWVDENTPELVIAVEPRFQGQEIGTRLLQELLERLKIDAEFRPSHVALSVREDSSAVRLYKRFGFVERKGSRWRNRTGGFSFDMVARL